MNREYAGVLLDLGAVVYLLDADRAVPTFHGYGRDGRARCGAPVFGETRRLWGDAARIPTRHAVKFARPCRRCWPQLLDRPSLFARPTRRPDRDDAQLEVPL